MQFVQSRAAGREARQRGQSQQPGGNLEDDEQPQAGQARGCLRGQRHTGDARVVQRAPENQAARVFALPHGLDRGDQQEDRAEQQRQPRTAGREQW